jgi:hypothetical protein
LETFHEIFMGLGEQAPCISAVDNGQFPAVRHDKVKEAEKYESI